MYLDLCEGHQFTLSVWRREAVRHAWLHRDRKSLGFISRAALGISEGRMKACLMWSEKKVYQRDH